MRRGAIRAAGGLHQAQGWCRRSRGVGQSPLSHDHSHTSLYPVPSHEDSHRGDASRWPDECHHGRSQEGHHHGRLQ